MTREQSEMERKRVHKVQTNGCTEQFQLRHIRNEALIFWRDEDNDKHVIKKGSDDRGSLIYFDVRQVWKVYFVTQGENIWNCEWKNQTLRLHRKDFERIFGKVEVG